MEDPFRLSSEQWRNLQVQFLLMYDDRVTWQRNPSNFTSPDYSVWLIRAGEVRLTEAGSATGVFGPGTWILIPPGYRRFQQFSADAVILSIHLSVRWPNGQNLFADQAPVMRRQPAWSNLESTAQELVAAAGRCQRRDEMALCEYNDQQLCRLRFLSAWYDALVEAGVAPQRSGTLDVRLQAALEILAGCDYCAGIPYDQFAAACGLSRSQIDRLFRRQLGKTPHKFMEEQCRQRVSGQLLTGSLPIKTICFSNGFGSMAHFSKWFRRQTGWSPRQYRNHHRR